MNTPLLQCFQKEAEQTAAQINQEMENREALCFTLLADTHYQNDGSWETTAHNIKQVLSGVRADGIIHLGDLTDGDSTRETTGRYVERIRKDLSENGLPVFFTLGNHDFNSFKGNEEPILLQELKGMFGLEREYYYRDFEALRLRCIFLSSCDIEFPVRYGFTREETDWLEKTLAETKKDYKVIVFSHSAPLPWLDYWAHLIRNGDRVMDILEDFNGQKDRQILAFIHGHTHAEYVYRGSSFPIISIGCSKCEGRKDKKPKHSHTWERTPGTLSQELWDMLLVEPGEEELFLVRFGAGEDRRIDCRKGQVTWRQEKAKERRNRTPKIWAYRGASGFAPANSRQAFEIARDLKVDGVWMEVCLANHTLLVTEKEPGEEKKQEQQEIRGGQEIQEQGFPSLRGVLELFLKTDYQFAIAPGVASQEKWQQLFYQIHTLTEQMQLCNRVFYGVENVRQARWLKPLLTGEKLLLLQEKELENADENLHEWVDGILLDKNRVAERQLVEVYQKKGLWVCTKDIDEETSLQNMIQSKVDSIMTTHPGKIRDLYPQE